MRRALLGLLLLAGCSSPEQTGVRGSVEGVALSGPTAVYGVLHDDLGDHLQVLISDDPQACIDLTTTPVPGRQGVEARPEGRRPSLLLVLPEFVLGGTARLGSDLVASFDPGLGSSDCVAFLGSGLGVPDLDAPPGSAPTWLIPPCGDVEAATSGTVELTRSDDSGDPADRAAGRFDLRFPNGERLEGSFVASPCGALGH